MLIISKIRDKLSHKYILYNFSQMSKGLWLVVIRPRNTVSRTTRLMSSNIYNKQSVVLIPCQIR